MQDEVRRKDDEISRLKKRISDHRNAQARGDMLQAEHAGKADQLL